MTEEWIPKTELGRKVKSGEITDIDEILKSGKRITEPEIVDHLLPDLQVEFALVGQAKGKAGGGKRIVLRRTQKMTAEGPRVKFAAVAIVGNGKGYVGLGVGSSNESVPAKEKAVREAKKNLIKVKLGCGSWECWCGTPHSIPFEVHGRESSVRITLKPAPKGSGLVINDECKRLVRLAGIKDIWSRTSGQTTTRLNLIKACFNALKNLSEYRIREDFYKKAGIVD